MADKQKPWQVNTERLAADIAAAARAADSEEDLKMQVEPLLQKAFKAVGVDVANVRYEKSATSFRGRSDAVYGFLTIEYKRPGALTKDGDVDQAEKQLQRYLGERAVEFRQQKEDFLEKAVGIATDGRRLLFVRFSKVATVLQPPVPLKGVQETLFQLEKPAAGFHRLGPYPLNASSLRNLLIFARASARRPLTAGELAAVFGPGGDIAPQAVSELYSAATRAQRRKAPSRVKTFFNEWDRIFGVVYGQELEAAQSAANETARAYQMPGGARLKPLLFAIHTFYAFLMKVIALELVALQRDSSDESFVGGLGALDAVELHARLSYMESGADFADRGIANFLEADFFSWYLDTWEPKIAEVFRNVVRALGDFEPATPVLEPAWTRDLLQNLYEGIVPKRLRRDLGEYYTPDWLAEHLVDTAGYTGEAGSRFLDPACGSGTFLVQAIHRAIAAGNDATHADVRRTAQHILDNVVGFDLNPLAVLAARTNYIIAFARFIPYLRPISIPVYLCDSVVTPTRYVEPGTLGIESAVVFTTTRGDYEFPLALQDKASIDQFTSEVELGLRARLRPDQFEKQAQKKFGLPAKDTALLTEAYRKIKALDDCGEDGIWARYIKNAFAPAYVGEFDYVIGNPPWIRWGYLADDYRERTLPLWQRYGLFSLKGHSARLGAGEKDFSMLFTYACMDQYVKDGGALAFLITMEVFKSKGAGEGFRRFRLKNGDEPFKITRMEDMVALKPFHAANKTALFVARKGAATKYPVPVVQWTRKKGIGRMRLDWSLDEVRAASERAKLVAAPVDPDKATSSWQTGTPAAMRASALMQGSNAYKARLGARVEPYGVFWLEVKEVRPDGLVVVRNMHERGKREIKEMSCAIESSLVFPAVTGGDIIRFGVASHIFLVMPQDAQKREPYSESWLLDHAPLTHAYLKQFEDVLLSRGSRLVREFAERTEFYAMYGIGEYTFAKYRVAWKRMASRMEAVVLSSIRTEFGRKKIVSTDTTSFFAVEHKDEAHYLCALLNSELVNDFISSFSSSGRGFGAPSVMENLAIPAFDAANKTHARLAALSAKAHDRVRKQRPIDEQQDEINALAEELWNIKS